MFFDDDDGFGALEAGAAYALYRHGQDRQTEQLLGGQQSNSPGEVHIHLHTADEDDERANPVNALDYATDEALEDWASFIGQEPTKQQLKIYIKSAMARDAALPHILLASGYPGVGKTTMARLIADMMGSRIYELVPPFNIYTLVQAAQTLGDKDILFIDEIHKLADSGKRGAEILLKVLEDKVAYLPDGDVVRLNDITVIGATTDRDKLPEPVIDRFKVKPYFQPYSWEELSRIAIRFAWKHDALSMVSDELAARIAAACRNTPRIIEEMIMAARDLTIVYGTPPSAAELLQFLEVEPDGLTRTHIHYLTAMRQYFAREAPHDGGIEYVVGEAAIQQILRETKQGLQRIEGFLVERGLIDRTPRGRKLTDLGVRRAEEFIALGKGAANAA